MSTEKVQMGGGGGIENKSIMIAIIWHRSGLKRAGN